MTWLAALIEALDFESFKRDPIKTRERIKQSNLDKNGANKPIRQALGFREKGDSRRPKFASELVQQLYEELNPITLHLPCEDLELGRAWENKSFAPQVAEIAWRLGPRIWCDGMIERESPDLSQLLVSSGQEKCCKIDLFWQLSDHRAYIILQLEHLLFVKAFVYIRNHIARIDPQAQSLVVRLRLSNDVVMARERLAMATSTHNRKRQAPHQLTEEEMSRNPVRLRTAGIIDVSSDEEDEDNTDMGSRQYSRKQQLSRVHSALSIQPSQTDSRKTLELAPIQTDVTVNRPLTPSSVVIQRDSIQSHTNMVSPTASTQMWSPVEHGTNSTSTSNKHLTVLRRKLVGIMVKELYSGDTSSNSGEFYDTFTQIWEADRDTILKNMSEEKYTEIYEAIEHWLQWREIAAKLTELTKVVPSVGCQLPLFSYEDWCHMLGGQQQYRQMLTRLHSYQADVQAGNSSEVMIARLMEGLSAATKSRSAVQCLRPALNTFYEQLSLWYSEIAGEES